MPRHGKRRPSQPRGHHRRGCEPELKYRPYTPMKKLKVDDNAELEVVARRLGVPDSWDVLICGDGSGYSNYNPCGWGWVLDDRHGKRRKAAFGALSCGTIVEAELLPAVQAMLWYNECYGRLRLAQLGRPINVHVITDNQTTVARWRILTRGGAAAQKVLRRGPLWNVLLGLEKVGFVFDFHWVKREQIALHILTDRLAGRARGDLAAAWERARAEQAEAPDRVLHALNASAG